MPLIAEGPLENSVITIRQVIHAVVATDLPAVATGNARADVTALLDGADPNSIVGRELDISTPTAPALVAVTAPAAVAVHRQRLKERFRQLEATPQLAVWSGADQARGRSFARWIEMMAWASATDSNLTDEIPRGLLLREAAHDARTWYWLHYLTAVPGQTATPVGAGWDTAFFPTTDSWTPSSFYCTVGPDAVMAQFQTSSGAPNTRGWVQPPMIVAGAQVADGPSGFDLAQYLAN